MSRDRGLAFLSPLVLVALAVGILSVVRERHAVSNPEVPGELLYRELMDLVKTSYVVPADLERVALGAAAGLMQSLDRHSRLFTPAEWEAHRRDNSGAFAGIGISTLEADERLVVMEVVPKSPAAAVGICPLDSIRSINGVDRESFPTVREFSAMLVGSAGTAITLGLQRPDGSEFVLHPERKWVEDPSVKGARLPHHPRVAWVAIEAFRSSTASWLDAELARRRAEGVDRIILDLRGNRGGLLESAVAVASRFLEGVVVVTTRGRGEERVFRAPDQSADAGLPLVVLVDRRTASAAEVLAAALADHGRASLLGERTFGKGVVQTELPLDSVFGAGVKLTTAHYFTPAGRCIEKDIGLPEFDKNRVGGLCPDLVRSMAPEEAAWADLRRERIRWTAEGQVLGDRVSRIPPEWRDPWIEEAAALLTDAAPRDRAGR